ncbi:MAG: hypothetical protein ACK4N5_19810 [Myxococcales bacterium]
MAETASFIEFNHALQRLVGKPCWSVIAGEHTGSMASLDFGRRVPRATPVRNRHLTRAQRQYEGEFDLFIEACAWRLQRERSIVCTSMSDNANDGPLVLGLEELLDRKVVSVSVEYPGYDLTLAFEESLTLLLFCDAAPEDDSDNYSFFAPGMAWAVGPGSVIRKAKRALR